MYHSKRTDGTASTSYKSRRLRAAKPTRPPMADVESELRLRHRASGITILYQRSYGLEDSPRSQASRR